MEASGGLSPVSGLPTEGDKPVDDKKHRPLIERKQAFAERQAARGLGTFAGVKPQGTGDLNRHGMPAIPIGQREVKNWPVLDLGDVPAIDLGEWRLEVGGLVERPRGFTWDEFLELPQVDDVSDFHCVTTWSRLHNHWRGVRLVDLADHVGLMKGARHVAITAYDHAPGTDIPYTTNVSIDEALQPDVLLVHTWEGRPLPREHGGPLRMITPQLYAWKGAKWIRRIEFLDVDRPGFWEERGYSNTAYPWYNDRYSRR